MDKVINKFDGEYEFLSNFYPCKVTYKGITYNHSEGAFQAAKTTNEEIKRASVNLSAGRSKRAFGKRGLAGFPKFTLRSDWEEVKDNTMYEVVKAKFEQNPDLKEKLLKTGDAYLIEGTMWHDNYWGDCQCEKCKIIKGKNQLGLTLMRVRDELRME